MESKKTPKADLESKSPLFFSIGLFITLTGIVLIFENKTYEESINLIARNEDTMEEVLDVPSTEQLPPPPPVVQQPQVIEIPDEEIIEEELSVNLDAESTEETKVEHVIIKQEVEAKEDVDEVFTIVEELATPVGGMDAFYKYVVDHMKYPAQARRMGVGGRVFCSFIVNKDGTIEDARVLRGIGAGCDEEALRVIKSAPRWNPCKQRGRPVRSRFSVFIIFSVN